LFSKKPSDVERLILLWDEVETEARNNLKVDANTSPQDKATAYTVYDTIHMALVSRLIKQAHGKVASLKTTATETKKTKTVTTQ